MNFKLHAKILILGSSFLSLWVYADPAEIQRLRGFAEHQIEQKQFDKGRERGEQEFLEEQELWERQRQQDLSEYRKSKKANALEVSDDGPEAIADALDKKALAAEHERFRVEYSKNVLKFDRSSQKDLVSEMEELDIYSNRPRYAQKGRVLYGAQAKYSKPIPKSRGSGNSSVGGFTPPPSSGSNGNSSPFPPPSSFDDFNDSGGFTPAPNMDNFGDDFPPPPPPPPPPMEGGGEFDFPPPAGEDFGF